MIRPNAVNREFELGGINHVALVCSDMARDIVTAVGTMNHLSFHVPAERFDEYRQRLIDKGVAVGPVLNHDDSPSQVAEVLHPGVFIRSFYFTDPDGMMLEFACWTKEFSDDEPIVAGRTNAERRPRPHPAVTPLGPICTVKRSHLCGNVGCASCPRD